VEGDGAITPRPVLVSMENPTIHAWVPAMTQRNDPTAPRRLGSPDAHAVARVVSADAAVGIATAAQVAGLTMGGGDIFMPPCLFVMENH
jgi:hypothetical protein